MCDVRAGRVRVRFKAAAAAAGGGTPGGGDSVEPPGHVCHAVPGRGCRCCECDLRKLPASLTSLGTGYSWALRPFLTSRVIHTPSLEACEQACADEVECATGTFTVSFDGDGECWLSAHVGKAAAWACKEAQCESFVKVSALRN